ncbi:gephyrin-like molybdotransferase receptor GlpR [Nocardia rhamnosiphila]|uniref:Gephyrin-like molybdotransferase receptor GlpR n=1 Tax=Nocardia rhamnosiphila TaxID=426716 RepID=A0ABV2WP37_9NOCA
MPNSILWIGLVVLWVFVLFPILADRHPRIRRTTDTALATRVLHRGDSKRRKGSGHARKKRTTRPYRKRHHANDAEDPMSTSAEENGTAADEEQPDEVVGDRPGGAEPESGADGTAHDSEPGDGWDHEEFERGEDCDEEVGSPERAEANVPARIPPVRATTRAPDPELEYDEEDFVPSRRGRGGYDPEADAIARAARYTFRQRAVVALVLGAVLCGGLAVAVAPIFWWGCGGAVLSLGTYLGYLRKQVRIEQEIRRRRSARLGGRDQESAGHGPADAGTASPRGARPGMDRDTARALRRRAHLLEPDDEDPAFEHLDAYDASVARTVRNRATGGEIRRAAGA